MTLSDFSLNLILASSLLISTTTLVSTISYHAYQLQQKINLEDNTLKALLTLKQNLNSSDTDYCAPKDNIINISDDTVLNELNLRNNYQTLNQNAKLIQQWHLDKNNGNIISTPLIIIHQLSPTKYLYQSLSAQTTSITLSNNTLKPNDIIVLDDCQHAIISKVISTNKDTLFLNKAIPINLKAPISIGTLSTEGFYIGNDEKRKRVGLYNYNGDRNLINPYIYKIDLQSNTLHIKAKYNDQDLEFHQSI